jgi:hypothetical protein
MSDHPFTSPQIAPEVREKLLDREAVAAAYAQGTIKAAAKLIGSSQVPFARALRYHNIPIRTPGQPPSQPASRIERPPRPAPVPSARRATYRWMDVAITMLQRGVKPPAMADLCRPNCAGRVRCLDGGRCTYERKETR